MADAVKELLSRWTLDTSSWGPAVTKARQVIQQAADADAMRTAKANKASQTAIDLLEQEIALTQQRNSISSGSVNAEKEKTSEIQKQQAAATAAARAALEATQQQIAAEKLKEAAAKAALAQQRASAQEAIDIAKNAMAQQKLIAQQAADAAKSAFADAAKMKVASSRGTGAEIPIVSAVEPRQELPERDGERVDKRSQSQTTVVASPTTDEAAQGEATAAATAAQAEENEVVGAANAGYVELAATTKELAIAKANLAETMAAVKEGTLAESAAEARLAIDLEAVAAATYNLKNVQSSMAFQAAEKERQVERAVALEQEEQKRVASVREQGLGFLKAYYSEEEEMQEAHNMKMSMGSSHGSGNGVSMMQKDRAIVDAIAGRASIRPIEALMSKIGGLGPLVSAAFPVIGIAMFVGYLKDGVEQVIQFSKHLQEIPAVLAEGFSAETVSLNKNIDSIKMAGDEAKEALDKFNHADTTNDNLAIQLDKARIKADELAASFDGAFQKMQQLTASNSVGTMAAAWGSFLNTFSDKKSPTSSTKGVEQLIHNAGQELGVTRNQKEIDEYNLSKNPDDPQLKATAASSKKAYDDKYSFYKKNFETEIAKRSGYSWAPFGTADPVPMTKEVYEQSMKSGGRKGEWHTPEDSVNDPNLAITTAAYNNLFLKPEEQAKQQADTDAQTKNLKDQQTVVEQLEYALQEAQTHYANIKAIAADAFSSQKQDLDKLAEANEQFYKEGTTSAQTYYSTKDLLAAAALDDELARIEKERNADIAVLNAKAATQAHVGKGVGSTAYKEELGTINSRYNVQANAAKGSFARTTNQDQEGRTSYDTQVTQATVNSTFDASMKNISSLRDANEEAFKAQNQDAEEYLQNSLGYIQQEFDANKAKFTGLLALENTYSAHAIELRKGLADKTADLLEQANKLQASSPATRLQYTTQLYGSRSSLLQAQYQGMTAPGQSATFSDQSSNLEQQRAIKQQQITTLASQQATAVTNPAVWNQFEAQIVTATNELNQLTIQLSDLHDMMAKVGSTVSTLAEAGSSVFTSRYAKGLESSLEGGASTAENATKLLGGSSGGGAEDSGAYSNIGDMFTGKGSLSDGLTSFGKVLTTAASAAGSFAKSIASAGSASAGALGGATGGAGLGQSISSAAGMAGPWGALIGGVGGAGLGAIMGQKQEEVQDDMNKLNATFKTTMASYSSNNTSLAATISSLQQLIAQAQASMASTKKGGSQYKDLIQQYNDQIQQLEDQQAQTMAQLQQQLLSLGASAPYQSMLSNIQSILTQYEQFAGAATNAQQLADANKFLTDSLQQLGDTYSQQLLQNETTAVQDALNLNDLYTQRNQLQQQFLQQTESIMGQGTLTRGITQSQSKYSKLYDLDVQNQNSMDNLNAQIQTEQYKVQAESQIFNLATTRQGLETQLVSLQQQGISLDMARIAAMQNLLAQMQSTGYTLNASTANPNDPNAAVTQMISALIALLTNGSSASTIAGSNGNSLLSSILGASYANQVGMGYAAFNGTNIAVG